MGQTVGQIQVTGISLLMASLVPSPTAQWGSQSLSGRKPPIQQHLEEVLCTPTFTEASLLFSVSFTVSPLGLEPRASHMLDKCSAPDLHPSPFLIFSLQLDFGLTERPLGPVHRVILQELPC